MQCLVDTCVHAVQVQLCLEVKAKALWNGSRARSEIFPDQVQQATVRDMQHDKLVEEVLTAQDLNIICAASALGKDIK